ncbi:hypothetical protein GCM10023116_26390 [Kistimonas scapharcae]|uniref:Uncharacterized protein n=1 Tax=Kistimonas scapharcae TaxID=1036133 RepID=A0ABP8V3H9_9GAMM
MFRITEFNRRFMHQAIWVHRTLVIMKAGDIGLKHFQPNLFPPAAPEQSREPGAKPLCMANVTSGGKAIQEMPDRTAGQGYVRLPGRGDIPEGGIFLAKPIPGILRENPRKPDWTNTI